MRAYQDSAEMLRKLNLIHMISRTDGFLTYLSGEPAIFYDKRCTEGRQRFTIAHELGRLPVRACQAGTGDNHQTGTGAG